MDAAAGTCGRVDESLIVVRSEVDVGAFFDYLEQLVWEVETGRLQARDARRRMITDWGGVHVRGYVPKRDPMERISMAELRAAGVPERTARAKVRGK